MPERLRISVDGVGLSMRVWPCAEPSRPPVVLLPATGEAAQDWDATAAPLSACRNVYALDLRGHGLSDWPGTYSLQLFTDDVIGMLGHVGAEPIDLVGHSLGGLVACKVAAARPDRIRRIVLEDVPLPYPRPAATPARPDGDLAFDWRVVEQVRPEIDSPDPTWPEIIARIPSATLAIAGGPSSPMPQAHVAELARRLPAGQLATISVGHLIHANKPKEFLQQVVAFLDA